MTTDRSIAPLVAQFVPLKIQTRGEQWQSWARKYPPMGNSIPIVYVVRADGELMYGQSGALPGGELARLLFVQLQQAGGGFTEQQLTVLQKAVDDSRQAREQGDLFTAVRKLAPISKLGSLGNLGSYAKAALEADELVQELTAQGQQALSEAEAQLAVDDSSLEGALALVDAQRIYTLLPELKAPLAQAARKYGKSEAMKPAEVLARARLLAATPRSEKQALEAYERVLARYPDSPAAQLAETEARQLAGEAYQAPVADVAAAQAASPGKTPAPALRLWTDSTGKFQVQARLVGQEGESAVLEKQDGQTIRVPVQRLSEQDQRVVRSERL